jgi:hypothetical protein
MALARSVLAIARLGEVLDELQDRIALLIGHEVVFTRGPAWHPAGDAGCPQIGQMLFEGGEVDPAFGVEGGDESGHDA